jgi:hypothetical protein
VPSSGSTIQRRPAPRLRLSPLLAEDRVARPRRRDDVADRTLGGEVGLGDGIGGRRLRRGRALAARLEALAQQLARGARGPLGDGAQLA